MSGRVRTKGTHQRAALGSIRSAPEIKNERPCASGESAGELVAPCVPCRSVLPTASPCSARFTIERTLQRAAVRVLSPETPRTCLRLSRETPTLSRSKAARCKHFMEFGICAPVAGGRHGIQEVTSSTPNPVAETFSCGVFLWPKSGRGTDVELASYDPGSLC